MTPARQLSPNSRRLEQMSLRQSPTRKTFTVNPQKIPSPAGSPLLLAEAEPFVPHSQGTLFHSSLPRHSSPNYPMEGRFLKSISHKESVQSLATPAVDKSQAGFRKVSWRRRSRVEKQWSFCGAGGSGGADVQLSAFASAASTDGRCW